MFLQEITPTPKHKLGLLCRLPIRTERLLIREFQLADARELYALHRDARATRYAGGTRSKEESFRSLCRIINRVRETGFGALALELAGGEKNRLLGWAGVQPIPGSNRYEVLYALNQLHWGKGLATEAARALLHAAFTLPVQAPDDVYALVFPQNIASIRVLEKLGMQFLEYYFDQPTRRYACLYHVGKQTFLTQTDALPAQSSSK